MKKERAQRWALGELANSYSCFGQPRHAMILIEIHNALQEKVDDKQSLAIGIGNLADDQLKIGKLASAEHNLRRSIDLCNEIGDYDNGGTSRYELGRVLSCKGRFKEAEIEFDLAFKIKKDSSQAQGIVWAYRALRALHIGKYSIAFTATQKSRALAEFEKIERDFVQSEWLLGAALTGLAVASPQKQDKLLAEAETHLTEALTRCRRINMVDHEPDILLAWGKWHGARGNGQEAKRSATEALAIADRCEYRLKQAEIHNFLAGLALAESERKAAQHHAAIAYERAWCDGPPHCYKPALEQAERMLQQLGAPLPKMS